MSAHYLYNYTIYLMQGDESEIRLFFYKSNSAPPTAGTILDLTDLLPSLEYGSEFKVIRVTIIPSRDVHDKSDTAASDITHVDIRVVHYA